MPATKLTDGEDVHPEAAADRQTQTKMNAIRRHK